MKPNKIERLKSSQSPYVFKRELEHIDFFNLDEKDRFYLKNYGIYNSKLRPEVFMLRIRLAGGRVSHKSLEAIVSLAQKYTLELLVTARAQLELHGLLASNILEVWHLLKVLQLTTLQTLTDNFRNIVTDPYDGLSKENKIEVYTFIEQMQQFFLNRPEWMGMLPRKFNTAICGTAKTSMHFFGNDLFFALAYKENEWGFNLYLGGKNSEVAQDADIFVRPQEVPAMFQAVAQAYLNYGLRGTRSKTRLFHLLDEVGMKQFKKYIGAFYRQKIHPKGKISIEKTIVSRYEKLQDGSYGYCYQSRFGKLDTHALLKVLEYIKKEKLQIRFGMDQNLYLLGIKEKSVPFETIEGASLVTACAGSHYCALSLWDIKSDIQYLPLKRIEKYHIQIGFSGCLKGCGRHYHCDIGLVELRTNSFGKTQKAARVYMGGEYTKGGMPARLIFPVVPLIYLNDLIHVIIDEFLLHKENDFEAFSHYCLNRFSSEFLMLWFLSKLYLKEEIMLEKVSEKQLYKKLLQEPDFPLFEEEENYVQSIEYIKHILWDDK
jgi:ferredoxin-nitrite reductase